MPELIPVHRRRVGHPDVGHVYEAAHDVVQAATGLPVFDVTSLIRMVHEAVVLGLPPRSA